MATEVNQVINCPKCGTQIPLTEALLQPLQAGWKKEQDAEWNKKLETVKTEAKKEADGAISELSDKLKETTQKLQQAQDIERELRRERDKVREREKELDLEVSRKVDEQTKKVKDELISEHSLKDRQKEEQIDAMRKQIEELKQKAEQGSQQAQGEALELVLEDLLGAKFPLDSVEPVPKGMSGADVIQRVNGKTDKCCGSIIWESKNTKNWNNAWIEKLKRNQSDAKAEIAVLASRTLPEGVQHFALVDDVWITDWSFACQLAYALRLNLIELDRSKVASQGKNQKMEMVYDYLTSTQFRQRVETIAGAFKKMREDLAQERDAMMRIWNKREKQIEAVIKNTVGMYGDIEGIVGAELPEIKMLELPSSTE